MISPMTKYSFILLSGQTEEFLSKLQDLGVIDVTRSLKPVPWDELGDLVREHPVI